LEVLNAEASQVVDMEVVDIRRKLLRESFILAAVEWPRM
jgi:hypothetical protein